MGKQTILTCDWHESTWPAVATYELRNGREIKGHLDLCQAHETALLDIFQPQAIALAKPTEPSKKVAELDKLERKRARDRDRHRRKRLELEQSPKSRETRAVKSGKYWERLEGLVLDAMLELKRNVHIHAIMENTDLTQASAGNTLRRLVAQGKVEAVGGRGRYRRYNLPAA